MDVVIVKGIAGVGGAGVDAACTWRLRLVQVNCAARVDGHAGVGHSDTAATYR